MRSLIAGVGAIFIDDIVLPDGRTYMGRLGGGVTHAMMGAALWGERPGIVALTGVGLPHDARKQLDRWLDTRGLHELPIPQMRAWQIFEHDGTRRELYRVAEAKPFTTGAGPEHFPDEYRNCRALYLLQDFEGVTAWRRAFDGMLLWEPLQQIMARDRRETLRRVLQMNAIDVVSPNLAEAQAVYGPLPSNELASALQQDGAKTVVLRMGRHGSLIVGQNGERWHVPAYPVQSIIDQTGAGNTYCGAFLLGIAQGKSLPEAGAMGAVAASLCLEQAGVMDLSHIAPMKRDHRLREIMLRIEN